MTIQGINNNKSQQNNIYAASSGTIAGVAGAFAGYNFAPKAANSIDELLAASNDTFVKTMDNMQTKAPEEYVKNYQLVGAKMAMDTPEYRANELFKGDKISITDFNKKVEEMEQGLKQESENIENLIKSLSDKKGKSISLAEYFEEIKANKVLSEEAANYIAEDLKAALGEENFKTKLTIDDELIDFFKTQQKQSIAIGEEEVQFYKNIGALNKDGFIHKTDVISKLKHDAKPHLEAYIAEVKKAISFESIKKYIPREGQGKWAAIAGISAAAITAMIVKLFGKNN